LKSTITKYIESTTDANFSIRLAIQPTYILTGSNIAFKTFVDGVRIRAPLVGQSSINKVTGWKDNILGIYEGESGNIGCLKKLKFSQIKISMLFDPIQRILLIPTASDNSISEEFNMDSALMSQVGEIMVKVYRKGRTSKLVNKQSIVSPAFASDYASSKIHEKVLATQR